MALSEKTLRRKEYKTIIFSDIIPDLDGLNLEEVPSCLRTFRKDPKCKGFDSLRLEVECDYDYTHLNLVGIKNETEDAYNIRISKLKERYKL